MSRLLLSAEDLPPRLVLLEKNGHSFKSKYISHDGVLSFENSIGQHSPWR